MQKNKWCRTSVRKLALKLSSWSFSTCSDTCAWYTAAKQPTYRSHAGEFEEVS